MAIMSALPSGVFQVAAARIQEASAAVLQAVLSGTTRPGDILEQLGPEFGDFVIKEAVLRLLREGELVLTPDRSLLLP